MIQPLPADLTLVIPCYNEAPNVAPLIAGVTRALEGVKWEIVFVDDDSPDARLRKSSAQRSQTRVYG